MVKTVHKTVVIPTELDEEVKAIAEAMQEHSEGRISPNYLMRHWIEEGVKAARAELRKKGK